MLNAAKKLKDGEYSTSVITTELGYHVILKVKSYEKDTLENLKEYGMEIQDDEIKKQYSNYLQNALASIASANSSTTK